MTNPRTGYTITISVGNSNTIFGVFAGDRYISKWRMETRVGRVADEYGAWLLEIFDHVDIKPKFVTGIVVSSVVPKVDMIITSMCRRFFDVEPLFVLPGVKTGMHVNYGRAGDLGPDRLANIVALSEYYKTPAIVVDFGAVTNFDAIDKNGKYLGGAIAPGVFLSLSSLSSAAPQLPDIGLTKPKWVIGKNTVNSMQSGCFFGAVEMVEGLIRRIWEEMGEDNKGRNGVCIATGGYSKEMAEGTKVFAEVDTNLTLKGLKLIYDRNR